MAQAEPRSKTEGQIAGLDLIRFAAALLVMFHHLGWRVWADGYAVPMSYHYLQPFARPGFVGVEIFFVLSGLVIAYSAQKATAMSFLQSRAIRLLPAAWICSTLTILLVYGTGHAHMLLGGSPFSTYLSRRWLNSLILYPPGPWVDGSYWTLGIECGFYLQVFLLLAWRKLRWLEVWMSVVGLVSTATLALLHPVSQMDIGNPLVNWYFHGADGRLIFFFFLVHHGCLFALGVLLWFCLFRQTTWQRLSVMALLLIGVYFDIRLRVEWSEHWVEPLAIWCVAMLAIVFAVRHNRFVRERLGERGAKAARRLGLLTYPLYLLHQVAGYALLATLKPYLPDLLNLVCVCVLLLLIAYAVTRFLEEPVQRCVRRRLHSRASSATAVPATTAP